MRNYANRGMALEREVAAVCKLYATMGIGMIQKIPTPMRQSKRSQGETKFWREKSTVDFVGVYRGLAVAFDAKETKAKSISLSSIKQHQRDFMTCFGAAGGVAFVMVRFTSSGNTWIVNPDWIFRVAHRSGKKSVSEKEIESCCVIPAEKGGAFRVFKNRDGHLDFGMAISNMRTLYGM